MKRRFRRERALSRRRSPPLVPTTASSRRLAHELGTPSSLVGRERRAPRVVSARARARRAPRAARVRSAAARARERPARPRRC
eukprot:31276-Pelagococcus_subviridis.AAC.2